MSFLNLETILTFMYAIQEYVEITKAVAAKYGYELDTNQEDHHGLLFMKVEMASFILQNLYVEGMQGMKKLSASKALHIIAKRICVPIEEVVEINDFERRTNATIAATLKNPPRSERSQQLDLQRNHLIEDVGVRLEEIKLDGVAARELKRGYVAFDTKDEPSKGAASFTSRVIVMNHPGRIIVGYTPVLDCHTSHVPANSVFDNHFRYPFDEAAIVAMSTIKEHCIDINKVHFVLFADGIYNVWVKKAKNLLPILVKTPSLSIMNNIEEKGPVAPGKVLALCIFALDTSLVIKHLKISDRFLDMKLLQSPACALKRQGHNLEKMTIKRNEDVGNLEFKARLVAKGFNQKEGIDYEETFSPVVKIVIFRCILSIVVNNKWALYQLDINNALLYEELEEDVYMSMPEGYTDKNDKIVFTGNDVHEINKFKQFLSSKFLIKDLGKLKYFLGIEVLDVDNGICLSQRKYCTELLSEFGMLGFKPCNTPIEVNPENKKVMHSPMKSHLRLAFRTAQNVKLPEDLLLGSVFLGNNLVSWKIKKQAVVLRFSTEAEYRAMCNVCCEFMWIKKVLTDLQVDVSLHVEMNCDNSSAIRISENPVLHERRVPGSFHGRLFPDKSMHLFHSSSILHWLSQALRSMDYMCTWQKRALQSCLKYIRCNFKKVLSMFLESRSKEMIHGGHMVLSLVGRSNVDPSCNYSGCLRELFSKSLVDMAKEPLVDGDVEEVGDLSLESMEDEEVAMVDRVFEGAFGALGDKT
ncbi:ribonuclease H-like domain-containing protein [Tanacetum coccineum]